ATLEDRSITIPMRGRVPKERLDPFHYDQLLAQLEPIRRKAARWALDHMDRAGHIPTRPLETLHDRAQDLWRPLLAIAEAVGGDWTDRGRRAAVELAGIQPEDKSLAVQLLARIQSMFEREQTDRLSSQTIVHVLADSEDRPWPEFAINKGSIGPVVGAVWHSPDNCSPQPHARPPRLYRQRLCRCVRPVFAAPANLVNGSPRRRGRSNEAGSVTF